MLLFDMDGTLIDSNGVWNNVDREFLARRGIAYTHEYYEGVAHTILPLAAKFTKEYCRLTESCEEIIAEWMEMARDLCPCHGEARRPGVFKAVPGRGPPDGGGDLQRAGALPHRPDPPGPDEVL